MSLDPSQSSADPLKPQTWNRYVYTLNNPLRFIDPDGLAAQDPNKQRDPNAAYADADEVMAYEQEKAAYDDYQKLVGDVSSFPGGLAQIVGLALATQPFAPPAPAIHIATATAQSDDYVEPGVENRPQDIIAATSLGIGIIGSVRSATAVESAGGTNKFVDNLSSVTGKGAASRNKAIDAVIKEDFQNLKFTHKPKYSPYANTGVAKQGVGTHIGKKKFSNKADLRNTMVHEELHHRWWKKGRPSPHHSPDQYIPGEKFYNVIDRYEKMRGWKPNGLK
jgi:hypothetical protein